MGVLTKSSINFDRNHRSHTLFKNNVSYHASNLIIFGRFVFEIFLKPLLGALGIWLSIYYLDNFVNIVSILHSYFHSIMLLWGFHVFSNKL